MNIREKLQAIQTELKAPKNLYNSFGKYSYRNAEGICEAVKPFLSKYQVSLVIWDEVIEIGGRVYVKAYARLLDCEKDGATATMSGDGVTTLGDGKDTYITTTAYAREADDKKGMDSAQITGATSSYARKYALNGLFLLDDTKDVDTEEYQAKARTKTAPKTAPKTTPTKPAEPVNSTVAEALGGEPPFGDLPFEIG